MTAELVIDSFAGGGGASLGIEQAIGRPVDIAVNHDAEAIAMHAANHPRTRHHIEDLWGLKPGDVTGGRPVGLAWFSPDCKHFSKAKGGRPVEKRVRALAWLVLRWASATRPRVIILENVEEFADWGPLTRSGRPCKRRKGGTFRQWVAQLRTLGYAVEWQELRACDYGAPTIRKRLFLIARRDGLPIVWPTPTHGDLPLVGKPYRAAAECIDWALPCPSIFERKRPLAEATLRRIAAGLRRYVFETADPFIVSVAHGHSGGRREYSKDEPLGTLTQSRQHALVAPTLIQTGYGERPGQAPRVPGLDKPLGTAVAGGCKHALVAAFMAQHNGGMVGHRADRPVSTICGRGTNQGLVTAFLSHFRSSNTGGGEGDPLRPFRAITAGGWHIAEVRAFLLKYYGTGGQLQDCRDPLHTTTTRARLGLVEVAGVDYQITDIGLRMLTPRELFRAQGFPDDYRLDLDFEGRALTKSAQIRMCGNSVCPDVARALVEANFTVQRQKQGEGRAA